MPASRLSAALWILAGSFAFAIVYASGKLAGGLVPALQIVWIRYMSGLLTVGALSAARPGPLAAARPDQPISSLAIFPPASVNR